VALARITPGKPSESCGVTSPTASESRVRVALNLNRDGGSPGLPVARVRVTVAQLLLETPAAAAARALSSESLPVAA
jgi:hypothetical protein